MKREIQFLPVMADGLHVNLVDNHAYVKLF